MARSQSEGQGLVEYALIMLLVSIVAIAALGVLGNTIVTSLYSLVVAALSS